MLGRLVLAGLLNLLHGVLQLGRRVLERRKDVGVVEVQVAIIVEIEHVLGGFMLFLGFPLQ